MRTSSQSARFGLAVLALVLGFGIIAVSAGSAEAAGDKRVCGTLPDTGYYNFIKAKNVSCKIAKRVSRQAGKNFCGHRYENCSVEPGDLKKGHTSAKGWGCEMKIGYEFFRAKCVRGDQKFVHESAV